MEEENVLEQFVTEDFTGLDKAKGGTLKDFMTEDFGSLNRFIFTFKTPDNVNNKEIKIIICADHIQFIKQDKLLDNVYTPVKDENFINKQFLEYENWHDEFLADTGNLSGPQYNLTMIFADGYHIEIENYTIIK